jgi:hypothetical protein
LLAGLGLVATFRGPVLVSPPPVHAQACPPRCATPIITPAWHMHMCDVPYQEQLDDNHCMIGPGVTEFAAGTNAVYVIYCHKLTDTVVVQIHDSGRGLQWVNHPDGVTYSGVGCETLVYSRPNGIPSGGSPFRTSAYWPEGPFTGIGAGIEWYIGLFVSFDAENYYGNDAQAVISARDPGANENPVGIDTIQVRVRSTSDPNGIRMTLTEKRVGFAVFESERPLTFSQFASSEANSVIKVANRDEVRVEYCPRNCQTPYVDVATWYNLSATITPTGLPTWAGPAPTATHTPEPGLSISYTTLRPAPADVGYVPQVSSNKDRKNHLGYPTLYAGMWTRGTNVHHGMAQFDLSSLPEGARIVEGRLELVGRESRFTEPGTWSVKLLGPAIDVGWREADYSTVHGAAVAAPVGGPVDFADLAVGRRNAFGLGGDAIAALNARLTGTRKASFRVDGPEGEDNNLFAWESGVDTYNRAPEPPDPALGPALHLAYTLPRPASATPAGSPTPEGSVTPSPTSVGTVSVSVTPSPTAPGSTTPTMTPPAPTVQPTAADPTATAQVTAQGTPTATPTATGPADQRQVCVLAFGDEDGDGARDSGERFLAGVTLRLTHLRTGVFDSWVTDGANEPDHCWSGLIDGEYSLKALQLPNGMVASGRAEAEFEVPFPGAPALYTFGARVAPTITPTPQATPIPQPTRSPTPSPEPTVDGPAGWICMSVYDDLDRDEQRGLREALVSGRWLELRDEARQLKRALPSRSDDEVCMQLGAGVYYASVRPIPNEGAALPAESPVLLTEGATRHLEFAWQREEGGRLLLPFLLRKH